MNTPDQEAHHRWGLDQVALALAYAAAGKLGLLLAIPPGYATAIWPPSGIALAGVLIGGGRMWPGVLLGSFLVNVLTRFDSSSPSSILVPLAIGGGAALQAVVSAMLVRRFAGFPNPLRTLPQIAGLLGVGGGVGCIVNATISVAALLLAGRISLEEAPFSWMTWWAGDAIGVFVFTPLILTMLMPPRSEWQHRVQPIVMTTLVTFVLCIALVAYTSEGERKELVVRLEDHGNKLFETLKQSVELRLNAVFSLKAFLSHSADISPKDYTRFCAILREKVPGIEIMQWIAQVPSARRREFEAWARNQGLNDFTISDSTSTGMIPSPERAEHFPVTFIYPLGKNAKVIGFDMASRENRLQTLLHARSTGATAVTERLHLIQGGEAILAVTPLTSIPRIDEGVPINSARDGFALIIFRLADIAEIAPMTVVAPDIHYWVVDGTDSNAPVILASNSIRTPEAFSIADGSLFGGGKKIEFSRHLAVGNRDWILRIVPKQSFVAKHLSPTSWYVLIGGMLLAGLMGALAMGVTGREDELCETVARHTSALKRLTDRYQLLFNSSPDALLIMSLDQAAILDCNQAAEVMLRGTREQILGKTAIEISPPCQPNGMTTVAAAKEIIAEALLQGGHRFEWVHQRFDGDRFWVEVSSSIMEMEGKKVYLVAWRDITVQKGMDQRLQETLAFSETVLMKSPLAMGVYRSTGQCVMVNEAYTGMVGASREQMLAQNFRDIWAFQGTGLLEDCLAALNDQQLKLREVHTRSFFDKDVWVSCAILPTVLNGEQHLVLQFFDQTASQSAQVALKESESRFRRAFDTAPHGMALVSTQGRWLKVNKTLCQIVGYSEEEMLTIDFQTITHPDDLRAGVESVRELLDGRLQTYQTEKRYFHKDGHIVWILLSVSLVRTSEGKPLHFVSQIQDITEQKRIDEQLRASRKLLDSVIENVPIMVFLKNASDLRFEMFNRAGEELLGLGREKLIGQDGYDLFPKDQVDFITEIDRQVLASSEVLDIPEERIETPLGTRILHTRKVALRDEQGNSTFLLGVSEDITQRKRAEENLRSANDRLELATRTAAIGIWEWEFEGNTLTWDGRMDEIYQVPAEVKEGGLSYDFWRARCHPEDIERTERELTAAIQGERSFDSEFRILLPDGTVRHIQAAAVVERGLEGRPRRMVGINNDLTAARRADAALRESEERHQKLFQDSPDAYLIMELDGGRISDCNHATEILLRGSRDRILDRTQDQLSPEFQPNGRSSKAAAGEKIAESLRQGGHRFEWVYRRLDGEDFWADVTISVVSMGNRQILLVAWRDISERKRVEAALIESETRFRLMTDSVREYAIFMLDTEGRVVTWNESAKLVKGYEENEIIGCSIEKFFTPEDIAAGEVTRLLARATSFGRVEHEGWKLRKGGIRYYADVVVSAMYNADQALVGFVKVARDITERKRAEEELRAALDETNRLNRLMLGRESQIVALKQQINLLAARCGQDIVYPAVERQELTVPESPTNVAEAFEAEVAAPLWQQILDSFCKALGISAAIFNPQGRVLLQARGGCRICSDFHWLHERSLAHCRESETRLAGRLTSGTGFAIDTCRNGLTDAAAPLLIAGRHVANVHVGPFLTAAA
ncbi:MAG: PAS domain S-box protein, partial [Magnetococcales bacterium]|nr:PAS domain S-box protein [Magnetococcales bacterium]